MSHSYWHIALVVGLLAIASPLRAQESDAAQNRPAAIQPNPSGASSQGPASALPTRDTKFYAPNCERPESREDASFCLERRATLAAEQSAIIADRGFWVTVWGTTAVLLSLFFTGWAAVAAAQAATSAKRAVDQGEAHAKIELRSYVSVATVDLTGFTVGSEPSATVTFQVSGHTPAINLTLESVIGIVDCPATEERFKLPMFTTPPSKKTFGPGSVLPVTISLGENISENQWKKIVSQENALFCWGCVTYTDVFGDVHKTWFRTVQNGDHSIPATTMRVCEDGNHAD